MTTLKTLKRILGKSEEKCLEYDLDQLKSDVPLTSSIEKFNNDLYTAATCHENGNFIMSGLSVHLALSMCSLGAQESTAKEMYDVLHFGESSHLANLKNIVSYLHEVKDIKLDIANRIYVDKSIVVKKAFESDVKSIFLSDVKKIDFEHKAHKAVNEINQWCSERTNGKIKNILSPEDITILTKLIVLNAVYFKALWKNKFEMFRTKDQLFHINNTETASIPTMHWSGCLKHKYLREVDAECVAIPYKDPDFVFMVIKPNKIDGLRSLEQNLDKIDLEYSSFVSQNVHLDLPKFKITSILDVNKYLEKIGMLEMFSTKANFKGISERPTLLIPLHIDKVFQKVVIEVDEAGAEAAAVTVIQYYGVMTGFHGRPDRLPTLWIYFTVDRPFLYRIVNKRCNLTLFSGRVVRPKYD